jgi:hypothetical protein
VFIYLLGACKKSFEPKSLFRTTKIKIYLEQISDFACGIVSSIWQKCLTWQNSETQEQPSILNISSFSLS